MTNLSVFFTIFNGPAGQDVDIRQQTFQTRLDGVGASPNVNGYVNRVSRNLHTNTGGMTGPLTEGWPGLGNDREGTWGRGGGGVGKAERAAAGPGDAAYPQRLTDPSPRACVPAAGSGRMQAWAPLVGSRAPRRHGWGR